MWIQKDQLAAVRSALSNITGDSAPREVRHAVLALLGETELVADTTICESSSEGQSTTWTVIGLLRPSALFLVKATRAELNWHFRSSRAGDATVDMAVEGELRKVADITAMVLVSNDSRSDEFEGDSLRSTWRLTWRHGLADLDVTNDVRDYDRRARADRLIEEIRRAVSGREIETPLEDEPSP